jgi:hypothetical protein
MEVKNRRRQDSPFTCLKPLIRVWGVATAIGECPIIHIQQKSKSSPISEKSQGFFVVLTDLEVLDQKH